MRRVLLLAAFAGCTPEPASTQELLQTVHELVDQTRAITIENDVVALATTIDPDARPEDARDAAAEAIASTVPCALVTPGETSRDLEIDFGADGCAVHGHDLTGAVGITYTTEIADTLLVTLTLRELGNAGASLNGTTRVTWGVDTTVRVVSELRLDIAPPGADIPGRQIEIQSDRIQRIYRGARQIDGWHRWQTLMGKWKAELGGWEQDTTAPLPGRGLAAIDTPFEHDVIVDVNAADDGAYELRANGGRADRVFMVAADGTILDLGDE